MSQTALFDVAEIQPRRGFTLVGRWYWITRPTPPVRDQMFSDGPSRAWLEWHWARGLDPFAPRRPGRGRHIPARLRKAVIERDGYLCGLCGGDVEPSDVHIDHILPVSLGGQDGLANLQVAHAFCNISKGARV